MMRINNLPDHVMPLTCFDSLAQVYHENAFCVEFLACDEIEHI